MPLSREHRAECGWRAFFIPITNNMDPVPKLSIMLLLGTGLLGLLGYGW